MPMPWFRLDAGFFEAATQGATGRRRHAGEEASHAPAEIDLVIGELERSRDPGSAVLEARFRCGHGPWSGS